jgi:mRNA interferase RelE/StbE
VTWTVEWAKRAEKQAARLDVKMRERVCSAVARFAESGHGDVKPLVGYEHVWRLRVGDWRVIFAVDVSARALTVLRVLPRGSAYRD